MEFEWDPAKNEANLKKHGFDFEDAWQVLEASHVLFPSSRGDEERFGAIGLINGSFAVVVYTIRSDKYRIISIRSARDVEKREYRQLYQ